VPEVQHRGEHELARERPIAGLFQGKAAPGAHTGDVAFAAEAIPVGGFLLQCNARGSAQVGRGVLVPTAVVGTENEARRVPLDRAGVARAGRGEGLARVGEIPVAERHARRGHGAGGVDAVDSFGRGRGGAVPLDRQRSVRGRGNKRTSTATTRVEEDERVGALPIAEGEEDPLLGEQALDEVEVALAELHAALPRRGRVARDLFGQDERVTGIEPRVVEHLANDAQRVDALPDAVVGPVGEDRERGGEADLEDPRLAVGPTVLDRRDDSRESAGERLTVQRQGARAPDEVMERQRGRRAHLHGAFEGGAEALAHHGARDGQGPVGALHLEHEGHLGDDSVGARAVICHEVLRGGVKAGGGWVTCDWAGLVEVRPLAYITERC
jgi:hypothetical protein